MSDYAGRERWHVHGIGLPDGEPLEWWVVDGQIVDEPVADAQDLPGGWLLPGGMVDTHAHLTMNFNGFPHADGSDALIAANLATQRAAGVLAVRDAGLAWGGKRHEPSNDEPRIQSARRLLAPRGRGYPNICMDVEADQLIAVALAEVASGAPWVKIMGDFPGPDGNWFAAPVNYPPELVEELVEAVHAAGARVMAHTTGLAAGELVRAGVDSIEHGPTLDAASVEEMARRGTAWTPTLSTALMHLAPLLAPGHPAGPMIRAWQAQMRELLALAVSRGVTLMIGTDELPHGALVREIMTLHEYGVAPTDLIAAASVRARTFLDLPAVAPGTRADLVSFEADPRDDMTQLARPTAIICGGTRVR